MAKAFVNSYLHHFVFLWNWMHHSAVKDSEGTKGKINRGG